jgi:ATP-dependent helicase HepA
MAENFHPGQRWVSDTEPELGLGTILRVTPRTVTATFNATGQQREYSSRNAPLRRVRFRSGDTIKSREGTALTVERIDERDGLIFYFCGPREVCETDLSDTISFNKPQERLYAGHFDPSNVFELRLAALKHQYQWRKSSVRGFAGGRIDLIPHQLYIAYEVAGRLVPRVLLADEVGLGKTIEACLIVHRLILTERASRVLILVPESLVHQWFVELLRRFNLWFHIFDEERCQAIEAVNTTDNPFLDRQFVLCSLSLFTANDHRLQQALSAAWDVLVVDEAHHLGWSPQEVSPEYGVVEALGRNTPGLILLTATPEQLGMASHFARLRLLDPDRFYDLNEFIRETEHYQEVARVAADLPEGDELNALLDRHGTGRVRFRNTRATMSGFPQRIVRLAPLDPDSSPHPMLDWLAELVRDIEPEKVLLICRTQAKVAAIDSALRQRIKNIKMGVFHEGLSLVQRDRNAAWFADKHGARILLCSEIGSEGRNFQFAHHLVLFDLPLDPELLEQRIGRLDRIGQRSEIQVHVPFVRGSSHEVLARWYQEGLHAFEKNIEGGGELLDRFGARLYELAQRFPKALKSARLELDRLIEETRRAYEEISQRLQHGRDRLLELNSFRPAIAEQLVQEIRRQDDDPLLDEFMLSIFDLYFLNVEELDRRTYRLGSAGVLADTFPGLPSGGFTVTSDRRKALVREDIQFLTWDHPLVTGALDMFLASEKGNSSLAFSREKSTPEGVYLEAIYLLESVAPPELHIDRFLPPTPLTVIVTEEGKEQKASIKVLPMDGLDPDVIEPRELREDLLAALLQAAEALAGKRAPGIIQRARKEMNAQLEGEVERLKELKKVNRSVRAEEIDLLIRQQRALNQCLAAARLRLDAIRIIERL